MSVSSVVEGVTDNEILIKVRKPGVAVQDAPDDEDIKATRPVGIDLREIKELDFKNSGTVSIL